MARTNNLSNFLTDVADAIRTKKGTSETILASDFDTEIENLPSGGGSNYNALIDTSKSYSYGSNGGIKSLIAEVSGIDISSITNLNSFFMNCISLETVATLDCTSATNMGDMFYACYNITNIIFSNTNTCTPNNVSNMFSYCNLLEHIDLRDFDFSNTTSYNNMFGRDYSTGVPNNCEIIVKDDTQKVWITSKFSRLTNVKTVAEYEAEQNA